MHTLTPAGKTKSIVLLTLIATFICGVASAISQESEWPSLRPQLHSDNWQQRAAAVDKLIANRHARMTDEAKNALLDLLDRENALIESTLRESNGVEGVSVKYGEGYSEYYSTLAGAVDQAADYNDKRTLRILVHSSYSPDSPFAVKLASQGEPVIPMLLELANSDLATYRSKGLGVLGEILKMEKYRLSRLPAETLEQVEQALIRGTGDEDIGVRIQAVRSLGLAGNKDTAQLLERIAQSDPAAIPAAAGKSRYPVREEAMKALSLIRAEEKGKPM